MSHLNIRTSEEDESHLQFLEEALGLGRSDATRAALSIAVEFITQKKSDKLQLLKNSEFIAADSSKKSIRIGFREKVKAKVAAKHGVR